MEPDSDSIAALAADIGHGLSAARLHGALAGGSCASASFADDCGPALEAALGEGPLGAYLPELREMLALTDAALADPDCGFEPLLPDEDAGLGERVEALAQWCDAFLLAFAGAREPGGARISAAGGELLADITAIAGGLDSDAAAAGGEQDEEDFVQILEFVRVAAMNLYAERGARDAAAVH